LLEGIKNRNLQFVFNFTFNVSPKMTNSWDGFYNEENITEALQVKNWWTDIDVNFKFVIETKRLDVLDAVIGEVMNLMGNVNSYNINNIYFMAEGYTMDETRENTKKLIKIIENYGLHEVIVAPRLHTLLWGNERKK